MSVADAARELGITEDAVRKAINAHRLSALG
jgi:transposase-like protein